MELEEETTVTAPLAPDDDGDLAAMTEPQLRGLLLDDERRLDVARDVSKRRREIESHAYADRLVPGGIPIPDRVG